MHARGDLITGWLKQQQGFDGLRHLRLRGDRPDRARLPAGREDVDQRRAGHDHGPVQLHDVPVRPAARRSPTATSPQSRIDDAVRRILREKFRLGLFEHPFADRSGASRFGSDAHRAVARKAARRVAGPAQERRRAAAVQDAPTSTWPGANADDLGNQAGGWTITWQGGSGTTTVGTTILQGIKQVAPGATVTYSKDASAAMAGNDVGVVVVGETPYAEGVGDIGNGHTFALSAADQTAISRVCGAMKCVVLLVSGRPLPDRRRSWPRRTRSSPRGCPARRARAWPTRCSATSRSPAGCPSPGRSRRRSCRSTSATRPTTRSSRSAGACATDSAKARLQAARPSLSGDAASTVDALLAADDWNADGSVKNAGRRAERGWPRCRGAGRDVVRRPGPDRLRGPRHRPGGDGQARDHWRRLGADRGRRARRALPATRRPRCAKFAAAANVSVSVPGGVGGTVPATLAVALGAAPSFGTFTPGVDNNYTAGTTATVIVDRG